MATRTARPTDVETVTKYLGDIHALEAHILREIDQQERLLAAGHPDALAQIRAIRDTLRAHLAALQARLQDLGGSPTHPVKRAVAAVAGVAAGLYDKVRAEEASKDLRDDYTALSHAVIAYTMLHTTALAFDDAETAQLCAQHLADNARFMQGIREAMPGLVVEEYRQDGGFALDEGAIGATRRVIAAIWAQPAAATGGAGLAREGVSGLLSALSAPLTPRMTAATTGARRARDTVRRTMMSARGQATMATAGHRVSQGGGARRVALAGLLGGVVLVVLLSPLRGWAWGHVRRRGGGATGPDAPDAPAAWDTTRLVRTTRQGASRATDRVRRMRRRAPNGTPAVDVDDATLVDRVRSEIFRDPAVPKGRININAERGRVVLRGEVDQVEQINALEAAARQVPGVMDVENLLHSPGTPTPQS